MDNHEQTLEPPSTGAVQVKAGDKPILQISPDGALWGVQPEIPKDLSSRMHGKNWLGKILMLLPSELRRHPKEQFLSVRLLDFPDFTVFGHPIQTIVGTARQQAGRRPVHHSTKGREVMNEVLEIKGALPDSANSAKHHLAENLIEVIAGAAKAVDGSEIQNVEVTKGVLSFKVASEAARDAVVKLFAGQEESGVSVSVVPELELLLKRTKAAQERLDERRKAKANAGSSKRE